MGFWKFWKYWKREKADDNAVDIVPAEEKQRMPQEPENLSGGSARTETDGKEEEEDGEFHYDKERHRPVIRASICTGEQVAGFKDRRTGRFTEIMLVRDDHDMEEFVKRFGISREDISIEW